MSCGGKILVVMAKAPVPGMVKTRLCPPLTPNQAAELHRCFVLDALDKGSLLPETRTVLAYSPADSLPVFEQMAPGIGRLIPQEGCDLGKRMCRCFEELRESEASVVLIGTDTPTLPVSFLREAFDILEANQTDIVFGPSDDGGYYLIGMSVPHPEVFRGVGWGTADVMETSLRLAADCRLRVRTLAAWYDIDTPDDLFRLIRELDAGPAYLPKNTARYLRRQAAGVRMKEAI